jgi:hypothetical protein
MLVNIETSALITVDGSSFRIFLIDIILLAIGHFAPQCPLIVAIKEGYACTPATIRIPT